MYLIGKYADLAWGAMSGLLAFKLAQDKNLPPERHLQQLLRRGHAERLQQHSEQAKADSEALARAIQVEEARAASRS